MCDILDLDAYFGRIGYAGTAAPTAAVLRDVCLAHAQAIAFENLDPLLHQPVRLDIGGLQGKLVRGRRGGYCFEHNTLLAGALRAMGFQVSGLAARVTMDQRGDAVLPRTHMLLKFDLDDGPMIADVGFGGLTPTGPLRLEADVEQQTPHESYRVVKFGAEFELQARIAGCWTPLYRFDLQAQHAADYRMMNHYTATHPDSVFGRSLVVALPATGRRHALRNNQYSVHRPGGATERRTMETGAEIRALLTGVFALDLPDDPGLGRLLDGFAAEAG